MNIKLEEKIKGSDLVIDAISGSDVEHLTDDFTTGLSGIYDTTQSTEKSVIELIFEVFDGEVEVIYQAEMFEQCTIIKMVEEYLLIICLGCGSETLVVYDPHSRSQALCSDCPDPVPPFDHEDNLIKVPFS